ncbi:MAG: hypothetical protein Q9169_008692 [Polycauliona sp. 2 TL-2023]
MSTPRFLRQIFDHENLDKYRYGGYHPTHINDTFQNARYKILHKLGCGGFGTVWLARDNDAKRYVALKIIIAAENTRFKNRHKECHYNSNDNKSNNDNNRNNRNSNNTNPELKMFEYLAASASRRQQRGRDKRGSISVGKQHLVMLLDKFEIQGPNGTHDCLVLPLLGPSVWQKAESYASGLLHPELARKVARQVSEALAYLHSIGIGHGGSYTFLAAPI